MIRPSTYSGLIAPVRALNTTFFFVTSVYCLLKYSPFTYEQFIKPKVSAALTDFAVWHDDLHWLVLSITALTLAPYLERPRAKWIGWSYLAASVALGVWLVTRPLWLQEGTSRANLILAIVAMLPPIWLAVFDHAAAGPSPALRTANDGRTWATCCLTAVFAFAVYAVAAPLRLRLTGGITLPFDGVLLGWTASALAHLTVFTLIYLALMVVSGLAALMRSPGHAQYWLLWALSTAAMTLTLNRVMLAPIGVRGPAAWIVSAAIGVALASAWSGVARQRLVEAVGSIRLKPDPTSALDAWLAPITAGGSRLAPAIGLVLAPLAIHFLIARLATFDWEFMLQKLATVGLWLVAFGFIHALTADRLHRFQDRAVSIAPAVVLALFAAGQVLLPRLSAIVPGARLNPEFALDGYAAVDPSFRIARDMLVSGTSGDAAAFYAYLRAHSTIQDGPIEPVDIDFAHRWTGSSERPPNVFLFIIDSLRPDYVSPYNKAVLFTPAIQAFADDSFVFTRAFSRYAGTGLSVPSIWAGAMLIHKQYVTPFAPMNALEKLVAAKGYRRFITEDHLTDELFSASPATVGLDHNVLEMLHTFCRTTGELRQILQSLPRGAGGPGGPGGKNGPPLFVTTRPLDLHVQNIASVKVPPGESYPGFYAPYASRVRRIDGCFGEFIETLKRTQLLDNSIIVLTSDHGDSLGEGQRWGHGYTAFPEVLRIPLIIHLPAALRGRLSADLGRLSFSTDITPTLYALLGEPPTRGSPNAAGGPRGTRDLLMGSPLLVDPSTDLSWRRRESYLVASSYGPVYGLLGRNGRRLYLADGVEAREYAYDLRANGTDVRVAITDAERASSRKAIRQQIGEIAAWYRFAPEP